MTCPSGLAARNIAHDLDAIAVGQVQVDERDIDHPGDLRQHGTGFGQRARLCEDDQIGLPFQNQRQWHAKGGMVIDEQETDR